MPPKCLMFDGFTGAAAGYPGLSPSGYNLGDAVNQELGFRRDRP
jgi:hypothetical protein